jgi:hypothetical protein
MYVSVGAVSIDCGVGRWRSKTLKVYLSRGDPSQGYTDPVLDNANNSSVRVGEDSKRGWRPFSQKQFFYTTGGHVPADTRARYVRRNVSPTHAPLHYMLT